MFCGYCGKKVEDDSTFCPYCGKKKELFTKEAVKELAEETVAEPAKVYAAKAEKAAGDNGKKKTGIFIAAAAAVLLLIAAFFVFGDNSGTQQESDVVTDGDDEAGNEDAGDEGETEAYEAHEEETAAASDTESVKELYGYLYEAYEVSKNAFAEYADVKEDNNHKTATKRYEIAKKCKSDIEAIALKADATKGLEPRLKNIGREYFEALENSENDRMLSNSFYTYYLNLYTETTTNYPGNGGYPEFTDKEGMTRLYNDLSDWKVKTDEHIAGMYVPDGAKEAVGRYQKAVDLNETILGKLAKAINNNDVLSYHVAKNYIERYKVLRTAAENEIIQVLNGTNDMAHKKRERSFALAKEVYDYSGYEPSYRDSYEFKNNLDGVIEINDDSFDYMETIYPSLYNSYDSILVFKTWCYSGQAEIVIEAEIPGFTEKYRQSYVIGGVYQPIYIKPSVSRPDMDLSVAKDVQLNVTIYEKDGITNIASKTFPVRLKSVNDFMWINNEFGLVNKDNILCYLTPQSSGIDKLKVDSVKSISELSEGKLKGFVGYQSGSIFANDRGDKSSVRVSNIVVTYLHAASVMSTMSDKGIIYSNDVFSSDGDNQNIKLPDQVLDVKGGLCIETSLVVASALQSAGFNTFIVLPTGHAQVAVETWRGSGEYLLIETTSLPNDKTDLMNMYSYWLEKNSGDLPSPIMNYPVTYMNNSSWSKYISDKNAYVIDCADGSILGLTPFSN